MKLVSLVCLVFLTACAKTGVGILDDISNPRKTCGMNITLQNSTTQDLILSSWGTESSHSAGCKPYATSSKDLTVPAGQSGTVELNMECQMCDIHPVSAVYSSAGKSLPIYQSGSAFRLKCTDTGCNEEI